MAATTAIDNRLSSSLDEPDKVSNNRVRTRKRSRLVQPPEKETEAADCVRQRRQLTSSSSVGRTTGGYWHAFGTIDRYEKY